MATSGVGTEPKLNDLSDSGLGDSGFSSADGEDLDVRVAELAEQALPKDMAEEDIVSRLLPLYSIISPGEMTLLEEGLQREYIPGPFMQSYLQDIIKAPPRKEIARLQGLASTFFQHSSSAGVVTDSHTTVIDLALALGYRQELVQGMCHGIASMGLIAVTEGRLREFNEVLNLIAQLADESKYDMERVKERLNLPENQSVAFEIRAFFDGIQLLQDSAAHPEYFIAGQKIESQKCVELVAALLTKNPQIEKVIPSFFGAYTPEDFQEVFGQLKDVGDLAGVPVNMLLSNFGHTIAVFYNPKQRRWYFLDANRLPIQVVSNTAQLAQLVDLALHKGNTPRTGILIEIFSTQREASVLHQALMYQMESENWQTLACFQPHAERFLYAARYNELEVIQECIRQGVDVHLSEKGNTALKHAAGMGHLEIMQALLEEGNAYIDIQDATGDTPLMCACLQGHTAAVEYLLTRGADITRSNDDGYTPLMMAAQEGRLAVVQTLLRKNPSLTVTCKGDTVLMLAAEQGHAAVVQVLVDHGADLATEDSDGWTALMRAAAFGNKATMQVLLQRVGESYDGGALLALAAEHGNVDVMQGLLEHGVGVDAQDDGGYTALMAAAEEGQLDAMRFLLGHGADVNIQGPEGSTALLYAAQAGNAEAVDCLLTAGAKPNQQDADGNTPLMHAAGAGEIETVQRLLRAGADKSLTSNAGWTALDIAKDGSNREIITTLES